VTTLCHALTLSLAVLEVVGLNKEQEFDPDLPAGGQFYCHETDKYFINQEAMDTHKKTKAYKRRVKELKVVPHFLEDTYSAAGMGAPDNGKQIIRP